MARRDFFKTFQQKSYQSRNYKNPHIKEKAIWNVRSLLIWLVVGLSLLALFGVLLTHQVFRIQSVEVYGTQYLDREQFETTVMDYLHSKYFFVLKRSNRFLFSPDVISLKLLDQFALSSVDVGLTETGIHIQLQERTSNLFWKTLGKLYVVDLEGVVVREVVSDDDSILGQANVTEFPIFVDTNNASVAIGISTLTQQEVENAFEFIEGMRMIPLTLSYIEIDRVAGKWIQVVTKDEYRILIDLTGDIQEQYDNLATVLTNEIRDTSTLEYIDLRFGDKIYYK